MVIDRIKRVYRWFSLSVSFLLISACESLNPVSPGPQPRVLEETEHRILFNVFGMLRPDSLDGMPLSFVHLEVSFRVNDDSEDNIIPDADVRVYRIENAVVLDSNAFGFTDLDVFPVEAYRDSAFNPQPGTYRLICRKEGIPELSGHTTIPQRPVIRAGSVRREENRLRFNIVRDEEAGLYEVVLKAENRQQQARFLRPGSGDVSVSLSLDDFPIGECELTIFAYDLNLSEYLTYNLSIKPHTYQKEISTVQNGYGCFGSLNVLRQSIDLSGLY